jgi:hypothetical protein
MKKGILQASLLSILVGGVLQAGNILTVTLEPLSGTLTGTPGATVGWGFTATWTPSDDPTYWASISTVGPIDQTNLAGVEQRFVDYMSPQGGPLDYALSPSGPNSTWTEAFDEVLQQGVGAYTILPGAILGAMDSGEIQIVYDVYNGDPLLGGVQQGGDKTVTVPYSVTVVDATSTPEPSSGVLLGVALALGFIVKFPGRLGGSASVAGAPLKI